MPETDLEGATGVAERMRAAIEAAAIPHPDSSTAPVVTLSFGVSEAAASRADSMESWSRTIERADQALYRAKHRGRNCVVLADAEEAAG